MFSLSWETFRFYSPLLSPVTYNWVYLTKQCNCLDLAEMEGFPTKTRTGVSVLKPEHYQANGDESVTLSPHFSSHIHLYFSTHHPVLWFVIFSSLSYSLARLSAGIGCFPADPYVSVSGTADKQMNVNGVCGSALQWQPIQAKWKFLSCD